MALRSNREELLVVMGGSRPECLAALSAALADYSHADLTDFESMWLEEWIYDDYFERSDWLPREELPLRRWRLRAAALEQHAGRRTA
jgi:hypothetical protein